MPGINYVVYVTLCDSMTFVILHMVCDKDSGLLQTFGCLEWNSELYRGIMSARCYSFNVWGHHFHNMNPQVQSQSSFQGYTRNMIRISQGACSGEAMKRIYHAQTSWFWIFISYLKYIHRNNARIKFSEKIYFSDTWYDKPPKDANGYGFLDASHGRTCNLEVGSHCCLRTGTSKESESLSVVLRVELGCRTWDSESLSFTDWDVEGVRITECRSGCDSKLQPTCRLDSLSFTDWEVEGVQSLSVVLIFGDAGYDSTEARSLSSLSSINVPAQLAASIFNWSQCAMKLSIYLPIFLSKMIYRFRKWVIYFIHFIYFDLFSILGLVFTFPAIWEAPP